MNRSADESVRPALNAREADKGIGASPVCWRPHSHETNQTEGWTPDRQVALKGRPNRQQSRKAPDLDHPPKNHRPTSGCANGLVFTSRTGFLRTFFRAWHEAVNSQRKRASAHSRLELANPSSLSRYALQNRGQNGGPMEPHHLASRATHREPGARLRGHTSYPMERDSTAGMLLEWSLRRKPRFRRTSRDARHNPGFTRCALAPAPRDAPSSSVPWTRDPCVRLPMELPQPCFSPGIRVATTQAIKPGRALPVKAWAKIGQAEHRSTTLLDATLRCCRRRSSCRS